jgi:hypothetical protein
MLTSFEEETYKRLYNNSVTFLKDGIKRLIREDDADEDFIENDLLTLTCISFQISIELAIRALLIENEGIRSILKPEFRILSNEEIENLFKENKLKTLDFDSQKKRLKSKNYIAELDKGDFKIIDEFQLYRNRIVHFSYTFNKSDLFDLKEDILYYLIHIIFKILPSEKQGMKPSEVLEFYLGNDLHDQLIIYKPYVQAMQKLAQLNSVKVYNCIVCKNRTFGVEEEYCYCCNFYSELFNLIKCEHCQEQSSVIFDNLNIKLNNNLAHGLCLNCDKDGTIYQCPECDFAYDIEICFEKECNCNSFKESLT